MLADLEMDWRAPCRPSRSEVQGSLTALPIPTADAHSAFSAPSYSPVPVRPIHKILDLSMTQSDADSHRNYSVVK